MTRNEQIEHVAKAIREAWLRRDPKYTKRTWETLPATTKRGFMLEAQAAIEAYESTLEPSVRLKIEAA